MHPMQYRKVKNGSGRLTHLQLKNSEIHVGINFDQDKKVQELIKTHNCYILYPGEKSLNLSLTKIETLDNKKARVLFILDATWPNSKKILNRSLSLQSLPKISFNHQKTSEYQIKRQPRVQYLSTIESTLEILKILKDQGVENCDLSQFTLPFHKMIQYQLECTKRTDNKLYRASK